VTVSLPQRLDSRLNAQKPAAPKHFRAIVLLAILAAVAALAPFLSRRVVRSMAAGTRLESGAALLAVGDATGAERDWRDAARIAPGDPNVYRALGALYLAQGRLPEARTTLHRLAAVAPREPHTLCELAEVELRARTVPLLQAAAEDGDRAAALEPECVRARTVAGNAWIERGDLRRGVDHLRAAVRLNPADVPLALHLTRSLLEAQQVEEAAQAAEGLTRRYPGHAAGYVLLGVVYQLYPPASPQGRSVRAVLERAVRLDPTNALAQAQLGHVLLNVGEPAAAVRYLQAARYLNPAKSSTLFDLSRAYAATGRPAQAERLARTYRQRSALENEVAMAEKRLVVQPAEVTTMLRLATLHEALGEAATAARYRHQAAAVSGRPGAGALR
jgi:tetratricopeptide (TPR) repeat protein